MADQAPTPPGDRPADDPLAHLVELERLRVLKARYFRSLDAKDWSGFRALFTDDATFRHPVLGQFDDIDAAVAAVRDRIGSASTIHHGFMPDLEMTGPASARGRWSMSSLMFRSSGAAASDVSAVARTCGEYEETYRRAGGAWFIDSLTLVSTYRAGGRA